MDKERFAEILKEEGYNTLAVDSLWEITSPVHDRAEESMLRQGLSEEEREAKHEAACRATARDLFPLAPAELRA